MTRQLAVEGGRPLVRMPISRLNTVTDEQVAAVHNYMMAAREGKTVLSGYFAGSVRGGAAVQRLEETWCAQFGVRHAIACNSCTSAIHAILIALPNIHRIFIPVLGMSAIAATAAYHHKEGVRFVDVDEHYSIDIPWDLERNDVVIAVNLFGHPAQLEDLSHACKKANAVLVEDNAQAPWATEHGTYTGTFGLASAWSFNTHKALNSGEGGMITTDDDVLAFRLREIVNHGEATEGDIGFNWRMTELTAVLALAQVEDAKEVVESRRRLAHRLGDAAAQNGLLMPQERPGCRSSWYCYPMITPDPLARSWAAKALLAEGVPVREGYVVLPKLPRFRSVRFTAEDDPKRSFGIDASDRMLLMELCSIDPSNEQVEQMVEAIQCVGERVAG